MFWRRRGRREDDLERELRSHLEIEAEEQRGDGVSEDEARLAARRSLGNTTAIKETVRESWGWSGLERLGKDAAYGLRLLRKSPGFSAVAILSLALGIGANSAIFGLIDALLLKSLPVRDPQSLLFLAKQAGRGVDPAFYYETYQRLRVVQPFFQEIAAFGERLRVNVNVDGGTESIMGQLVSGNYYGVLGVPPAAGRLFTADDDRVPGGHAVAILSYSYWQRRFGGAASAIGGKVLIDGTPFTVVGVTPPGFYGLQVGDAPEISVPIMMQPQVMPDMENWLNRPANTVDWLNLFGRLRPGVTVPQATSGLQALFRNIQTQLAEEIGLGKAAWRQEWVEAKLVLVPGGTGLSHLRNQYSSALFVLLGMVGVVLLIACANVGNLLMARAAARRREIALRLAIGASRGRLIRQLLVESMLLSVLGGLLGIGLSFWVSELLLRVLSVGGPSIRLDLAMDWRAIAFTSAVSVATGVIFGLAPAMRGSALDLSSALKAGGRGASAGQPFARALTAAQIGLSLVLLVGAGLLVRTLRHLDGVDDGFPRERVYTVFLAPRGSDQKNTNGPRLNRLYADLLERIRAIPGVAAASLAGGNPVMALPRRPFRTTEGREFLASWDKIYPGYFAALGSAVIRGRDFTTADMREGAALVTIVNQTLAREVFAGEDPVGKRIACMGRMPAGESGLCEVIGVVRDVPYAALKAGTGSGSTMYMTFLQSPTGRGQMELIVRASGGNTNVAGELRQQVAGLDPYMPAFQVRSLAAEMDAALTRERLLALVSSVFGGLAALLAAIGLYGVVAYSVGRRAQEIGVRMALGARPGGVQRLVVRETLTLASLGIVCGLPAALVAGRLLSGFLSGVAPNDSVVLSASVAVLLATAAIAGYIPARRAARIDPVVALREE